MSRNKKKGQKHNGSVTAGHNDVRQGAKSESGKGVVEASGVFAAAEAQNPVAAVAALTGRLDDTSNPTDGPSTIAELAEALKKARAAQEVFNTARADLEQTRQDLDARTADLANQASRVKEEVESNRAEARTNHELAVAIQGREESVLKRETDAEAGFLEKQRDWSKRFEEQRTAMLRDLESERAAVAAERLRLLSEIDEVHRTRDAKSKDDFERREGELSVRAEESRVEERRLSKLNHRLELDRGLLEEEKAALDSRLAAIVDNEREKVAREIRSLDDRLKRALTKNESLVDELQAKEMLLRRVGSQDLAGLANELDSLKQERDQLRTELGQRPSGDLIRRLTEVEHTKAALEGDNVHLQQECGALQSQLSRALVAVTEIESLRNEREMFRVANERAKQMNAQLKAELQQSVEDAQQVTPFATCHTRDESEYFQADVELRRDLPSLADFVLWLQHRIASDPEAEQPLFYMEHDLRAFLAGLAMSRLHILQGVSGTGKTTLPRAFARAIGGGSAVVEVQAGWRDRQDLVGYYNSFERRFYEQKFLVALYDAQCPRYAHLPFFIVLDEMNLSHPEQYAADLLSQLEQERKEQRIELMTFAPQHVPRLIVDGRFLPIPRNAWFIGTANHDETTRDFADKTYDRAHVLELPTRPKPFKVVPKQPGQAFAYEAFEQAFTRAKAAHLGTGRLVFDHFQEHLASDLGNTFGIGWGSRLLRQLEAFVPVYISSGPAGSAEKSLGEAADHILATKILRKLKNRHDILAKDIDGLREVISSSWVKLGRGVDDPARSLALLEAEMNRLGHGLAAG